MPKHSWTLAAAGLLLCACSSALAAGANAGFTVDVFGTAQGLPSSAVLAVTQTRDGYLWVGTLDGLARFDGVQFAVFDENNTPGLNSSEIIRLLRGPADQSVGGHRERRHRPGQRGQGHQRGSRARRFRGPADGDL